MYGLVSIRPRFQAGTQPEADESGPNPVRAQWLSLNSNPNLTRTQSEPLYMQL